jgi:prephenate dehydrogenase
MIDTLAIVGVGLVGGSIALAARARQVARRIVGVEQNEGRRSYIRHTGLVDDVFAEVVPALTRADLVLLCTPVDTIVTLARQLLSIGVTVPISDVGSTKAQIVQEVEKGRGDRLNFIGGHPLAGSDKSGPEHASATLFENRYTFLTPTRNTDPRTTEVLTHFWTRLGARVEVVDADEHDRLLAVTSHLPHLTAYALAGITPADSLKYAGTGWSDTTRLAGSEPTLWAGIALSNRKHLLDALAALNHRIDAIALALGICDQQQLVQWFEEGRKARHALGS